jgi:D-beta-D-heptose 7-phosphate kinase/D-beta-D-heptose 1-phosphate adenosyltransferase
MNTNTIVIVSGGFDPLHTGHIEYLRSAKMFGMRLFVGVNSDDWLKRKKGNFFMPFEERLKIVESIKYVDQAMGFNDDDDSAAALIRTIRQNYPDLLLIFANGGDRIGGTYQSELEMKEADERIIFAVGVGGTNKTNSSTNILDRWTSLTRWKTP